MTDKGIVPRSVAIIGLGPSRQDFISEIATGKGDVPWDEVWVMNTGIITFNYDLGFVIDDLKLVEERLPRLAAAVKQSKKPIITATAYDDFPTAQPYPYDEILQMVGIPNVFANSGPMALAYAYWKRVKKIFLYGFDYTYPKLELSEFGGQALAFLLGMAGRFGASVEISPGTSLLGNCYAKFRQTDKGVEMDWPYYGKKEHIGFYDSLVKIGDK